MVSAPVENPAPTPDRRAISVLGSTGSIGRSTLDLVRQAPDSFEIAALTAFQNLDLLCEQAAEFRPKLAVIGDETLFEAAKSRLRGQGFAGEIAAGPSGLLEAGVGDAHTVVAAIVGAAGLAPTLAAVEAGKTVALANKECLVCAGDILIERATRSGAKLLPTDSEHNAIFQVLYGRKQDVEKLILTASGGPFRNWPVADIAKATPAQAVAHPNWSMGAKISVDSATMMNKGLELIEAAYLFDMTESAVEIVVHPQSIIHSMVQYRDGSVLAQMGAPDMRIPIAYTLAWPDRMATTSPRLDFATLGALTFEAPDLDRFPALRLARNALKTGGTAPPVLNAANEVAVAAFLDGSIAFGAISRVVETCLDSHSGGGVSSLDDALAADADGRRRALAAVAAL